MSGLQSCVATIQSNIASGAAVASQNPELQQEAQKLAIDDLTAILTEMNEWMQTLNEVQIQPEEPVQENLEALEAEKGDEEKTAETDGSEKNDDDDKEKPEQEEKEEVAEETSKDDAETAELEKEEVEATTAEEKMDETVAKISEDTELWKSKVLEMNSRLQDWLKRIGIVVERCETLQPVLSFSPFACLPAGSIFVY